MLALDWVIFVLPFEMQPMIVLYCQVLGQLHQ
jgi:hypothetical protein